MEELQKRESILEQSKQSRKIINFRSIFKKFKNKKVLIILGAVILVGVSFLVYKVFIGKDVQAVAQEKIYTVKKGDIKITADSDGNVTAKDGVDLSFPDTDVSITNVYVSEGSTVKKGDKIASSDVDSLQIDLQSAYASLQSAVANLKDKEAGATANELISAQNSVDSAQASLEKTILQNNYSIKTAENSVESAQNNLKLAEGGEDSQVVRDAYDDLLSDSLSILNSLSSILDESDKILGIDNTMINDDFEDVLSALNTQHLTYAESSYNLAKEKVAEAEKQIVPLSVSFDKDKIFSGGKLIQSALLAVQQHLYHMGNMLDNTLAIGDLSQTQLDSFKSTVSSKKSTVISSLSTISNSIKAIDTAKTSYDTYLTAYQTSLDALEKAKKDAEVSELTARISLQSAQINQEETKELLSDSELASARSQVANAQSNVSKILYNIEQSTITTPIDGEVVLLNGKTGDIIVEDKNQPFCTILNKEYFYVETSIDESDINKVKIGQKAYVTISALDESVVEGEVTFVSLTSEVSNGIVSYSVKVLLKNTTSLDIREGMTASVEFVISEANDVLMVPVAAVKNINGKPSVYLENGDVREVTTGFTDGKLVEVISGLSEGENVKY